MNHRELHELVLRYEKKLLSYKAKKLRAVVIIDSTVKASGYSKKNNQIVLKRDSKTSFFHEMGHELFEIAHPEKVFNFFDFLCKEGIGCKEDAEAWLDLVHKEYCVNDVIALAPISDVFSMVFNCSIKFYYGHQKNYLFHFKNQDFIVANEFFASVVNLIAIKNFKGIEILLDFLPSEFYKCLDWIDQAMQS